MESTKKEKGTDNKIFRPVSVPLVTVDPFFSIWSMSDKLYDDTTRFWTGKRAAMTGVLVVDGNAYRFMGKLRIDNLYYYKELPTIEQIALRVYPTKTEYEFENDILHMTLSFRTPLLMDDLKLMSRPVSYISYTIDFKDGKTHNTRVYFDICSEITSEIQSDIISFGKTRNSVYCGKGNKDVLNHGGDATMIEWGNVHLAMPNARYGAAKQSERCGHFQFGSDLPETMEPCAINEDYPFLYGIREYNGAEQISDFTKSDWQIWSTCLTGDRKYRDMVIDAMWRMICEMKSRLPFSDWYWTSKPDMRGFANRTVQGGLYLPMLKFS